MKVLKIYATGSADIIDTTTELPALQKHVDGWIEMLHVANLGDVLVMVVNEEGRIRGMPFNEIASELAGQPLAGDVLVFGSIDSDGGLTDYVEV